MSHPIKKKKEIGAFYTPPSVSRILSDWAIRTREDNVLEPSFGGCGFLEAARDRLLNLGSSNVSNQIFGCDIDKFAFDHLTTKFGLINVSSRFILGDFLLVTPKCFAVHKFDAVLGNPPYISHHNMDSTQKEHAHSTLIRTGVKLSTKASLWAYFLIHGIDFVKDGGRMAWVLPGSILNSKYGKDIHEILKANFSKIVAVVLNERIFLSEGAEERSIIVLCENKGTKSSSDISVHYADTIASLEECVFSRDQISSTNILSDRAAYNLIDKEEVLTLNSLYKRLDVCEFGEIADIKIGIVTGDNGFFIINKELALKNRLTTAMLKPIVTKYRMISGLALTNDDLDHEINSKVKCLLVDSTAMRKNSTSLIDYLETYPADRFDSNKTFAKRRIWHRPNDGKIPDAFMSYMQHNGPRIALNTVRTTCTNTIHRIYFKNISEQKQKMATISFLSTLTQISAEIEGRSYGSGVLKQEPSEARKLKIFLPAQWNINEVNILYTKIDNLLRAGNPDEARIEADKAIYSVLNINSKTASTLDQMLIKLRRIRQR